ncbi:MAG TPA: methyl-accepting chemotaxis protein [Candidatus Binataceae bacterium]|nr:methyl-accepting chemotaxis protein [Candidatus Binataceae bacterium]
MNSVNPQTSASFLLRPFPLLGVNAPLLILLAAGGLLLLTAVVLGRFLWIISGESRLYAVIVSQLNKLKIANPVIAGEGLSPATFDAAGQLFEISEPLRDAWRGFQRQVFVVRNGSGDDRFYSTDSADGAFNDSAVIEPRINRNFYSSFPGIITGLGLLFTFVAILFALKELHFSETEVKGVPDLVEGLAGKFVSSVAALFAASVFLFCEKLRLPKIENSRRSLVAAIDALVPRRTAASILADLHRDIAEQSAAFRSFNADFSLKLRQGFSEGIGPLQQRMVDAIDELNRLLRSSEAQKQESITGTLSAAMEEMQRSIASSLTEMGARFTDSLSGNATQQFERVAASLNSTASLLESMNAQFRTTQAALNELVSFAKNSTTEQFALGKAQTEELTAVLNRLMNQMNETAGSSVANMSVAMAAAAHELSAKVAELSEKMSSSMLAATEQATGAAGKVVEQAGSFSAQNSEQIARMLERFKMHFDKVEDLGLLLDGTLAQFKQTLPEFTRIAGELRATMDQVGAAAARTAESATAMRTVQEAIERVAGLSQSQVEQLASVARQTQADMQKYQQTFDQVRKSASELLAQIAQHLNNYTQTSRNGFEGMVKLSNDQFDTAVQRLGASIEELREYLDDLNDLLGKLTPRLRA